MPQTRRFRKHRVKGWNNFEIAEVGHPTMVQAGYNRLGRNFGIRAQEVAS